MQNVSACRAAVAALSACHAAMGGKQAISMMVGLPNPASEF
ncbi:hypothetical protein [Neisseria animalis]|nr:hypothetical protein [Neisseria animalis]